MIDTLQAIGTIVDNYTIAILQPGPLGDDVRLEHEVAQQFLVALLRRAQHGDAALGDEQQMDWCLRRNVVESQDVVILVHDLRGDLLGQDLVEDRGLIRRRRGLHRAGHECASRGCPRSRATNRSRNTSRPSPYKRHKRWCEEPDSLRHHDRATLGATKLCVSVQADPLLRVIRGTLGVISPRTSSPSTRMMRTHARFAAFTDVIARCPSPQQRKQTPVCQLATPSNHATCPTRRATLQILSSVIAGIAAPAFAGDTSTTPFLYSDRKEVTLENGMRYFDLSVGDGAEAVDGSTVLLHYTSRLGGLYGIRLDGTRDGSGAGDPIKYTLGDPNAVACFDRALHGMQVGTVRRVLCPPSVAYQTPDNVPAVREFFARRRLLSVLNTVRDSTIVFDIELLRVKR